MKKRNGFVTNSSSSSFILGFKNEDSIFSTLSKENLGKYFEIVYRDCMSAKKMSLSEVLELYRELAKYNVLFI